MISFLVRVWCSICRYNFGLTGDEEFDASDKMTWCPVCEEWVRVYSTYYGDEPGE